MKAKTKRRLIHVFTKKKLVKKKTGRAVVRTFLILLATVSTGSLAYAITMSKPVISIPIHGTAPGGVEIKAPTVASAVAQPVPAGGAPSQVGRSSWYGVGLAQPDALTCASRTFPRGTYLNVTNLRNGRSMVCRVNDYGPEVWTGRVLDLSRGSFRQIDDLGTGTIPVELRVATGATGYTVPLSPSFATLNGYNLCRYMHTAIYCDANRRD